MLRRRGLRTVRSGRPRPGRGTVSLVLIALLLVATMVAITTADNAGGPGPAVASHDALPALDVPTAGSGVSDLPPGPAAVADPLPAVPDEGTASVPPLPKPTDPRLAAVPAVDPPPVETPAGFDVPVLMYHFIRVPTRNDGITGYNLSIPPADLADQLTLLRRDGFHGITLGQLMDAMTGGAALPEKPVVLTFDDGFADFAGRAAPLLLSAGFRATVFVVSGFMGRPGYMSADQVRDMAAKGMTIGAHTIHHSDLAALPEAAAEAEITTSREDLQSLTGQPISDFAYPSGRFTPAVERLVARAGFRDAVTTVQSTVQKPGLRLLLNRTRVYGGITLGGFANLLRGGASAGPAVPSTVAGPAHGPHPVATPRPSRRATPSPAPVAAAASSPSDRPRRLAGI